jgi:hypothetical protein
VRASDLLRYRVRTADGVDLGRVTDFRAIQDGPVVAGTQRAFRVDRLVVGRGGLADRLGYLRGEIAGPWLVRTVMRRFERRAHLVRIVDIDRWDDDRHRLVLRPDAVIEHPG